MMNARNQRITALTLMIFAVGVFYWQVWTPREADRAYFEGDLFDKDYPMRAAWVGMVHEGVFPFWNPYEFGGWPALANCEAGILYPLNWLLVIVAPGGHLSFLHLELFILLHFVLGGWFFYLLARQYGLSFFPALLSAFLFMLCGFHGGHKLHANLFCTIIWFPLILYFVEQSLKQKVFYPLLWAALFLGIAYLAGHPQMAYYFSLLLMVRFAWELPQDWSRMGRWESALGLLGVRIALLFILAIGLSAVQLLPSLELFGLSQRAGPGSYAFAVEYSLPPQELVEFLLPDTFYWYFIEVFYIGVWAWFLAWATLNRMDASQSSSVHRKEIFWLVLWAGSLLLALGEFSGLYSVIYSLLPGLGKMRAPSRWIYFANFSLALLAGFGLQRLMLPDPDGRNLANRMIRVVRAAIILAGLALIYLYVEQLKPFPQVHLDNLKHMIDGIVLIGIFLGLGWILLRLYREKRISAMALGICFCILIFVDLATYNNKINVVIQKLTYQKSPITQKLRQEQDPAIRYRYIQPDDARRKRAIGNVFSLEESGGMSPLAPLRYCRFLDKARSNRNLLCLMGIRYFVSEVPEAYKENIENIGQDLWCIPDAFPRAFAVEDLVLVRDPDLREALLDSEAWDYARLAWVNRLPEPVPFRPTFLGSLEQTLPCLLLVCSGGKYALHECAYILVDGRQVCPGTRGYNLVVLDPVTGEVERTDVFDTLIGRPESERMARFIQEIPEGKLVVGAVRDEGTSKLSPEAVQSLRSLGVGSDVAGEYRLAHAFIGIKGIPPGSALDLVSPKEAILAVGARGGKSIAMTTETEKLKSRVLPLSKWEPGKFRIPVDSMDEGFLVVTENHYPGWYAKQKDKLLNCVEANTLFLAVSGFTPGTGDVKMKFRPTHWVVGLVLTFLSFGLLIAGLIGFRPRKRNPSSRFRQNREDIKSFLKTEQY